MELRERLIQASIRGDRDGDAKAAIVAEWHEMIGDLAILRQVLNSVTFLHLIGLVTALLGTDETPVVVELNCLNTMLYAHNQLWQLLTEQHLEHRGEAGLMTISYASVSGNSPLSTAYEMINGAIAKARQIGLQLCP